MNRSAREDKSVKRFERSNGPDTALYKNYLFYLYSLRINCIDLPVARLPFTSCYFPHYFIFASIHFMLLPSLVHLRFHSLHITALISSSSFAFHYTCPNNLCLPSLIFNRYSVHLYRCSCSCFLSPNRFNSPCPHYQHSYFRSAN